MIQSGFQTQSTTRYRAYKYRIYPTAAQANTLAFHFGAVRYVYNRYRAVRMSVHGDGLEMWPAESRPGMCAASSASTAPAGRDDQCRARPAGEGGGERPVSMTATIPRIRSTMKTSIAPVIAEGTPFFPVRCCNFF